MDQQALADLALEADCLNFQAALCVRSAFAASRGDMLSLAGAKNPEALLAAVILA
jgi:hypothetical protein